jgi:hypothetical protein
MSFREKHECDNISNLHLHRHIQQLLSTLGDISPLFILPFSCIFICKNRKCIVITKQNIILLYSTFDVIEKSAQNAVKSDGFHFH